MESQSPTGPSAPGMLSWEEALQAHTVSISQPAKKGSLRRATESVRKRMSGIFNASVDSTRSRSLEPDFFASPREVTADARPRSQSHLAASAPRRMSQEEFVKHALTKAKPPKTADIFTPLSDRSEEVLKPVGESRVIFEQLMKIMNTPEGGQEEKAKKKEAGSALWRQYQSSLETKNTIAQLLAASFIECSREQTHAMRDQMIYTHLWFSSTVELLSEFVRFYESANEKRFRIVDFCIHLVEELGIDQIPVTGTWHLMHIAKTAQASNNCVERAAGVQLERLFTKEQGEAENVLKVELVKEDEQVEETATMNYQRLAASILKGGGYKSEELKLFARELCSYASALFKKIEPREFAHKNWTRPQNKQLAPHLMQYVEDFNRIGGFVTGEIVKVESLSARAKMKEFWIDLMDELFEMNDLHTAGAILAGLNHHSLTRLNLTHREMSSHAKKRFEELDNLFSMLLNFRSLRAHVASLGDQPYLPFEPMLLRDLQFADDGNPEVIGGKFNVDKLNLLGDILLRLHRLQKELPDKPLKLTGLIEALSEPLLPDDILDSLSLRWEPSRRPSLTGPDK